MLSGFNGASKDKNINLRLTNLNLIGGVDCKSGRTPDLKIKGGARIHKSLCVGGNISANSINVDNINVDNINVDTMNITNLNVSGNSTLDHLVVVNESELGGNVSMLSDLLVNGDTHIKGNLIVDGTGGAEECPPLKYVYFVAQNGDDLTGDGSSCKPYLTIQKGIDEAYLMASMMSPTTTRPVVWVMPGTYTENPVLKANVLVRGLGYNDTRVNGNWTIDSTFTTPPSNDGRSGWADIGLFGTITADFQALNSNEGKLFVYNSRLTGTVTLIAFSSINQFLMYGGEYFGDLIQYGMVVQFNAVIVQGNPTITVNYSASGGNSLTQNGGTMSNVVLNAIGGPVAAFLMGNTNQGSTLTINNTGASVVTSATGMPVFSSIIFTGGATMAQISRLNDAFGQAYTPSNLSAWSNVNPTSVANALDRIAATIGTILP